MKTESLTLELFNKKYAVCSFDKEHKIPSWVMNSDFLSITKTNDELSIVCEEECIKENIKYESDWRILKIIGPLDFSLIGILSKISTILADSKISIFAVSTYDTDYILVKDKDIKKAIEQLEYANYNIINK